MKFLKIKLSGRILKSEHPYKKILYFIQPNPFTTITYELQQPATVEIAIYNHLGEQLAGFTLGSQGQGEHAFSWQPCELQAGVYYCVVRTDDGVRTVKMIKMK